MTRQRAAVWSVISIGLFAAGANGLVDYKSPGELDTPQDIHVLKTKEGIAFSILGTKRENPAPTLIILSGDAKSTLRNPEYLQSGSILERQGYLCISVDLPCHGAKRRSDEPEGLAGWRHRTDSGENPIRDFVSRLIRVLDHLIAEKYTDPERVAVCGISRGAFSAMHYAAADSRVKCMAIYAPVTDLKVLREFQDVADSDVLQELDLMKTIGDVWSRPLWVTIGDHDKRVSTDSAIKFARAVSAAALASGVPAQVELHVCPAPGHVTPSGAADQSARWIANILRAKE